MKYTLLTFLLTFIISYCAYAHVGLDFPQGGETFEANSTITIQWHIEIDHGPCNWDIYFSSDGGSTWDSVVLDLPKAQLSYDWLVPEIATQQGKIRVVQDNENGSPYDDYSGVFTIDVTTGTGEDEAIVQQYELFPAYPNPFNPETKIRYQLAKPGNISLIVYDLLGNEIQTLVKGEKPAGTYEVNFNGSELSSGVYVYRLSTGNYTAVKKLVLLK